MYEELAQVEILHWREDQRSRIEEHLTDALPGLLEDVEKKVSQMSVRDLVQKKKHWKREIEPIFRTWTSNHVQQELAASGEALEKVEIEAGALLVDNARSAADFAVGGAAVGLSLAPVGAGMFVAASGLTTAGTTILGITFGSGTLLAAPVAVFGAGAFLFGLGPTIRRKAKSNIQNRWAKRLKTEIRDRVLSTDPERAPKSLLLKLFDKIDEIAAQKLGELG